MAQPLRVTLDTNCVIDLEENRPDAPALRQLIQMHDKGQIVLCVVGVGASERKKDGGYRDLSDEYTQKVEAAGLGSAEVLPSRFYFDFSYWGEAICIEDGDPAAILEQKIHEVLFPQIEFVWEDYCRARDLNVDPSLNPDRRWNNAKCDVLAMWSHIYHKGDIFITRDPNFLKTKKPQLQALGAGQIFTPGEALAYLSKRAA